MSSPFTRDEHLARIAALKDRMRDADLDGAVILQRVDMIYYTGVVFPGALVVPATGDARIYAWRRLNSFGDWAPAEPIPVKGMGHLFAVLADAGLGQWKTAGLEEDVLPVATYKALARKVFRHSELRDVSSLIRTQRMVKSPAELDVIRRSGAVLAHGFHTLRDLIREGEYEYDVQAKMDVAMRHLGDQISGRVRGFNAEAGGVVASGPSAAVDNAFDGPIGQPGRNPLVPKGAGGRQIQRNEPVICDHTAGVDGYMTDMTRTYAIGELAQKFIEGHEFCVWVHKELLRRMTPGAIPAELYQWVVDEAERAGFADGFMNRGRNKVRFVGHGVGLELDEWPVLAKPFTDPLQAGMVLAVEPKIIFEDGGVGVEDTVIVREDGPAENVTEMDYDIQQVG